MMLSRRSWLGLPLLIASCGGDERIDFTPPRYDYLPPIPLNVLRIEIEQRFFPSGVDPDVSPRAPLQPVRALRDLAEDRLRPFGGANKAVYVIQDASLIRRDGALSGAMGVTLDIIRDNGERAGYVEARVVRRESGGGVSRGTLFQMVKTMLDQMNVELEFQIRRNLRDWLTEGSAAPTPVQQAPLEAPRRL
jgi:hypothetical protein